MSKRKREENGDDSPQKKPRKGFSVGPANLPDGTYRRKTQKIKDDLISKAKVKKAYAKLKSQEAPEDEAPQSYDPYAEVEDPSRPQQDANEIVNTGDKLRSDVAAGEIHPERQAMLDRPEEQETVERTRRRDRRPRKQNKHNPNQTPLHDKNKPVRYKKEFVQAEEKKAQLAVKEVARAQREKERRAMTKARRPGKDGKLKLGRQSQVLLSRVKRLTEKG